MLTDEELPPLPEPSMLGFDVAEPPVSPHYSAGQMREYARAVEQAAYEKAAQECIASQRGDARSESRNETARRCADAIRALAQGGKNDA